MHCLNQFEFRIDEIILSIQYFLYSISNFIVPELELAKTQQTDPPTDRQYSRPTHQQTDNTADRPTNRQTIQQTDPPTDTIQQTDPPTDRQYSRPTHQQTDTYTSYAYTHLL
uniref:Ovule protein n=1 Tax=Ascaris lumbricoides TaxID=6252 RepID=A0A0M3I835_ASCLU